MANFNYDPNQYEVTDFELIPAGDYRVRIADAVEKTSKSGNAMFEITLDVSGKNSKLWYYLVLSGDFKQINQRIGTFYDCFGIQPSPIRNGVERSWIGKIGGVRVKHEEYNGTTSAKVHYLLRREKQENLEPWVEPQRAAGGQATAQVSEFASIPSISDEDLPFGL